MAPIQQVRPVPGTRSRVSLTYFIVPVYCTSLPSTSRLSPFFRRCADIEDPAFDRDLVGIYSLSAALIDWICANAAAGPPAPRPLGSRFSKGMGSISNSVYSYGAPRSSLLRLGFLGMNYFFPSLFLVCLEILFWVPGGCIRSLWCLCNWIARS